MRRSWLRNRWLGVAALALLLFLTLVMSLAPASNQLSSGSSWSRAPDGYGAWFASMQAKGPVQRWQRPLPDLLDTLALDPPATDPVLMQILPQPLEWGEWLRLQPDLSQWLESGYGLIVLGVTEPVTAAPFTSHLATDHGRVTIQTRRRAAPSSERRPRLADTYGAIVWQQAIGPSGAILAVTPFLGANAYLDQPGNLAFLTSLVPEGAPLYIDEYLHGYRDRDIIVEEVAASWLSYLAQTPLAIATLQAAIIVLLVLLAQNRRPGGRRRLPSPQTNDSEAYIRALAAVLHRANSQDFLVDTLRRSERQALQKQLGLGQSATDASLKTAWQQLTGQPASDLDRLQGPAPGKKALQDWLAQLSRLRTLASQRKSNS